MSVSSQSLAPVAAREPAVPVSCFSLMANAEPGLLSQVFAVFARRGLVPSQVHSTRAGTGGEDLDIDVQVAGLSAAARERLAQSLRGLVCVRTVLTSEKQCARSA